MTSLLAALRERAGGYAFGGDYNPEQWDRAVWAQDVAPIREAGVSLVTPGVLRQPATLSPLAVAVIAYRR